MTYVAIALYLLAMPATVELIRQIAPTAGRFERNVTCALWPILGALYLICRAGEAAGFEWAKRVFRQ